MENKYKIKVGATAEYLNKENSSSYTAKFISKLEGKKIFLQKLDEEDESLVWVSQYEKTESQKIPVSLLELDEEIETEEDEKEVNQENIKEKALNFLNKNMAGLVVWFCFALFLLWIWNITNIKGSILDVKQQTNTWVVVSSGQTIFEAYTQRIWILEAQENFELDKQKRVREEKRKAVAQYDAEINASIEAVKLIRQQKDEIAKQKIELAK